MINIPLFSLIAWYFYHLAANHQRPKWLWGLGGIALFYGILGLTLGVFMLVTGLSLDELGQVNNWQSAGFWPTPISLLSLIVIYFLLKRNWSNTNTVN